MRQQRWSKKASKNRRIFSVLVMVPFSSTLVEMLKMKKSSQPVSCSTAVSYLLISFVANKIQLGMKQSKI